MAGDNLGVGFRYEDIRDLCHKAVTGDPLALAEDTTADIPLKTAVTRSGATNDLIMEERCTHKTFHFTLFSYDEM